MASRPRGRPAHIPGPSYLSYTPNGDRLVTVGANNHFRVYQTGSDDEPVTIDGSSESNTAVAAANDFFIVGSEDGTVSKYSLKTNNLEEILVRCQNAVRDIALSPDGNWAAVASDETVIKVVNTKDQTQVLYLREQPDSVKHVTFDRSGTILAASCKNGLVYFYSLSSEEPRLLKTMDGLITPLETESESSSRIEWHPSGGAFGAATNTRDFQVVSRQDWSMQKSFKDGHSSAISAAAWSPNGALLVTTGVNRRLILWDAKSLSIIRTYDDARATILAMQWHPKHNTLAYTNNDGELYIHEDFLSSEHEAILERSMQKPPFLNEAVNGNHSPKLNGITNGQRKRYGTPDSLSEILGLDREENDDDEDNFIEDDDGAGYAEALNQNGKRTNGTHVINGADFKRCKSAEQFKPLIHEPFQPGSTPWRGNRRYLCLNLIGAVWTIDQDSHNTVTVEFYDREFQRDFHFTDVLKYDKACLNTNGTLFSCDSSGTEPAQIYYRPHQTWTTRTDWRTKLPPGESITAIALSDSYVTVSTSAGYIRVYSLFGVPFRIYRQKASPAVTCASWRDYVMTIGNGGVGAERRTQLTYTLENVKRDETIQAEDIVALAPGATLQNVFFSDAGDPCIYDSTGTLLVLAHWRKPGQAKWVPLLDTRLLDRRADGRKQETYWPVAVDSGRFHCIILKGEEKYPYFPRPLLSDFEFKIPLSSTTPTQKDPDAMDTSTSDTVSTHEHTFVLNAVLASLLRDAISTTRSSANQYADLNRLELESDKALLQLLGEECLLGEDRGMKALEICTLMPNGNEKMFELARRVALKYGREMLAEKIEELEQRRVEGKRRELLGDGVDDEF